MPFICRVLVAVVALIGGPLAAPSLSVEPPACDPACVAWATAVAQNRAADQGNWLAIAAVVQRTFPPGTDVHTAYRIIDRESNWYPGAENPTSSASGLFQMLDGWNYLLPWYCPRGDAGMYRATCAIGAAAELYKMRGWRDWGGPY